MAAFAWKRGRSIFFLVSISPTLYDQLLPGKGGG